VQDTTTELNDEIFRFVRLLKASAATPAATDRSAMLLLWPLLHAGPMRLRELAEAKGTDASTVSRQAAQLVRDGLARRDPDPDDGRACLVALTEQGRAACQRMIDGRREAIAAALAEWSDEEISEFTRLFRQFNRAVEAYQLSTSPTHETAGPAGTAHNQESP
jgi:DNA-binding MarR family transcriptional regulator